MPIICNLCNWDAEDTDDTILEIRMTRHEGWHTHCKRDKRNTVEGKVKWKCY
jgi:hypothetical protein